MAQQAGGRRAGPEHPDGAPDVTAYLRDYALLLDSLAYPTAVLDRSWDVVLSNSAYDALFHRIGPHPTAMPRTNFLRFVLFHPDAGTVLGEHESSWCLPLLAHFAQAVKEHPDDGGLQAIRREIAEDPLMEAAYRQGLPHWLRVAGPGAAEHDGSLRLLAHPDPRWGRTSCRLVGETPRTLESLGYRRMTFVLHERRRPAAPARTARRRGHSAAHLTVVPPPEG